MSTIANAKVEHNYNRYNGYFFGCLHNMVLEQKKRAAIAALFYIN